MNSSMLSNNNYIGNEVRHNDSNGEEMTRESEEQLFTKHNSQVISKMKQAQTMIKSLEINLECPICLDKLEDTHVIPQCQHRFCGPCIKECLRKCNTECPSCRVHVPTRRSLRPDKVFDSLVSIYVFSSLLL